MANSHKKSNEELSKSSSKKHDDKSSGSKKINSTLSFIERRKDSSSKSPPNPFMSRLNISSFLNLMVSDKTDNDYKKKSVSSKGMLLANSQKKASSSNHGDVQIQLMLDCSNAASGSSQCPVCANELSASLMFCYTNCNHYACIDCWQSYVINRIENYEIAFGFTCLTCANELPYHKVIDIIKQTNDIEYTKRLLQRLENFTLERALKQDQNYRRCPNPGCEFAFYLIPDYSGCKELHKCQLRPGCKGQMCGRRCLQFWAQTAAHDCKYQPSTSSQAPAYFSRTESGLSKHSSCSSTYDSHPQPSPRRGQSRNLFTNCFPWLRGSTSKRRSSGYQHGDGAAAAKRKHRKKRISREQGDIADIGSPSTQPIARSDLDDNGSIGSFSEIKSCPKCHTYVLKMNDGSCNHMVCVICGCEFCWLCMRQITDMHYLSPSGCTFWGRRQWNVEKRALWQLGTLIGAPIAIGFLAALAIPAMVIGIPLYVGRKIHGALKTKNKDEKRTIAVLGGLGAFVISPVIAAITVGLGVPLILAYVYVVMPIALCRASACSCDDHMPDQPEVNFTDVSADAAAQEPNDLDKDILALINKPSFYSASTSQHVQALAHPVPSEEIPPPSTAEVPCTSAATNSNASPSRQSKPTLTDVPMTSSHSVDGALPLVSDSLDPSMVRSMPELST